MDFIFLDEMIMVLEGTYKCNLAGCQVLEQIECIMDHGKKNIEDFYCMSWNAFRRTQTYNTFLCKIYDEMESTW